MPHYAPPIRIPASPFPGSWVLFPYDVRDLVDEEDAAADTLSVGVEFRHAGGGENGMPLFTFACEEEAMIAVASWSNPGAIPADPFGAHGFTMRKPQGFSYGQTYWVREALGGTLVVNAHHGFSVTWTPTGSDGEGDWLHRIEIVRCPEFTQPPPALGLPYTALPHAAMAVVAARLSAGSLMRPSAA